jgi:hypothetical protein
LKLCVRAGDRAGFDAVVREWESELEPLASQEAARQLDYVEQTAHIAFESAAIGDLGRYQTSVDRAEKVLAGVRIDSETAKSSFEQKPAGFLWIAAARARAGDSAGVARDEAASKKAGPLDPEQWDYPWSNVVEGYADAGRFDEALAAAPRARDDNYKGLPTYVARRQAQAGRFAEAWKTLAALPARARLRGEYDLIVRQVRATQTDGLAARIDAIGLPSERALADIAVGATLLNRPFVGMLRAYAPKED